MTKHLHDTHFHLDLQKDKHGVIENIAKNEIYTIAMTNLPDLYQKETLLYDQKYIRIALGFHPELVHEYPNKIPLMWKYLAEARYIGEVGLDFTDKSYVNEQIAFFTELIARCKNDTNKIISIHSREAEKEVIDIIGTDFKFTPILHWYSGTIRNLKIACERGYYFSVNLSMTRTKKFAQMLECIPKDKLLLETDSPFTSTKISHLDSLKTVNELLNSYNINCWENFLKLIGA